MKHDTLHAQSISLLCTVGGSHEPIIRAIQTRQPDYICFICSSDDPASGSVGSYKQITGKGNVIKANITDSKPTLPNIPTQANLQEKQFEVLKVLPDDFDDIYKKVTAWLEMHLVNSEKIIADYTGGTKTMSAALVAATLENESVALQLITGSRGNLVKIETGSEFAMPACVTATRFRHKVVESLTAWQRYAYQDVVSRLSAVVLPEDSQLRAEHQRTLDVSRALMAWDRFDHQQAYTIISRYRQVLGKNEIFQPLLGALDLLNKDCPAQAPMRLYDLWRNAQRRATQQRYDDAVARLYRLLEWSAQWLLKESTGIETADVPVDRIPNGITLTQNREGKYQAALLNAWELVACYGDDGIKDFWCKQKSTVLDLLKARNHSILAHGFTPLGEEAWQKMAKWAENKLIPLLLEVSSQQKYRIKKIPDQLPKNMPAFLTIKEHM